MGTSLRTAIAVAIVLLAPSAQAAPETVRQFMQANCQQMTDKCTAPIIKALDAAAAAKTAAEQEAAAAAAAAKEEAKKAQEEAEAKLKEAEAAAATAKAEAEELIKRQLQKKY